MNARWYDRTMLNHVEQLKNCKTIQDLRKFVNLYATGKNEYTYNFRNYILKETNFEKALQSVWNFALQQDGKYFLGRESTYYRRSGGAITGLECHSSGHR